MLDWLTNVRKKVAGASGRSDAAFRWILAVEAPGQTFEALADSGDFSSLDAKLGADYNLYNSLNMRAQRATLKCLEANRKINSSIPNKASGLGSVDAMNQKL